MSKPNTDQPTPLVVAGEATDVTNEPAVKKHRIRTFAKNAVSWTKEHKKTTIAVVALGALVTMSALAGRSSDTSSDEPTNDSDVPNDAEGELSQELDNPVA